MHVDLFEVKEENKDLEANTQAGSSEAKGGFQIEDGIRTGLENLIKLPGGKKEQNLTAGTYEKSPSSGFNYPT